MSYDETVDAELATLIGAGGVAYIITRLTRRAVEKHEARRACNHDLYLDATPDFEFSKLRCRRGCGHQETARDYINEKRREREERIHAQLIGKCPKCGGEVPPGA